MQVLPRIPITGCSIHRKAYERRTGDDKQRTEKKNKNWNSVGGHSCKFWVKNLATSTLFKAFENSWVNQISSENQNKQKKYTDGFFFKDSKMTFAIETFSCLVLSLQVLADSNRFKRFKHNLNYWVYLKGISNCDQVCTVKHTQIHGSFIAFPALQHISKKPINVFSHAVRKTSTVLELLRVVAAKYSTTVTLCLIVAFVVFKQHSLYRLPSQLVR